MTPLLLAAMLAAGPYSGAVYDAVPGGLPAAGGTVGPLTLTGDLTLPATGALKWSTRAQVLSTADAKLKLSNAAGAAGVVLDFSTDGTLSCRNFGDSAACTFGVGFVTTTGSGTASAPAVTLNDSNTGFYRSAADTAAIAAAGVIRAAYNGVTGATLYGTGTKGAYVAITSTTESLTFAANPGDASKTTSTPLVPRGARVDQIVGRVTTAGTNCTSIDIGDGTDADLYANDLAVAQNTTFTAADATADWSVGCFAAGGCNVTVTANGGNCFGLVVALTAFYTTGLAPTSN